MVTTSARLAEWPEADGQARRVLGPCRLPALECRLGAKRRAWEITVEVAITEPPKLPPVWFKHLFWRVHRLLYRLVGERALWTPSAKRGWGAMHLTTIGRRSGQPRSVIVGYIEDGSVPVVLAMNGWDEGVPAWWRNLEVQPDAHIRLKGEPERPVRARRAEGDKQERLWQVWAEIDDGIDALSNSREADTPVVVFEPRDVTAE